LLKAIAARLNKQNSITQPYIDEMKRAADSLSQLAFRDPLTSLPNRILLHQRLQEALSKAKRSSSLVAVLCINLNRFNAVNDSLGYATGDLLLQAVAQRLQQAMSDGNTVARLGGDEFSIVLGNISQRQNIGAEVLRLLETLDHPYELNGHSIQMQPSLGIAIYPDHGLNSDQLLHQADVAMRYAKTQKSSPYEIYNAAMDLLVTERRSLESKLQSALERDEFQLYYQPQANLITGRIIGVEALLRWRHPELGMISPAKFIPIAEETGLIVPIGEWVLRSACSQTQAWRTSTRIPIRTSINLSARQFKQHNLVGIVSQALTESGLDPDMLVLEMTETSVMEDVDATVAILRELKEMGVHISIDDFGTGYSSLSYLKRFPLDTLKIDQSFVRDVTTDDNDAAIAKAIIAMANSLQLKVIAEGVETEEQFHFLRQSGCHAMQGYLFSPPVPAREFENMLSADKRL
jgi:diguanylate cyclase